MQKVNGRGLDSALFMPVNFTFYQYILNIYEENQNNMFHFYINYHINIYMNITFLLNPRQTHREASPCPCAVYSSARLTIFLGVPLYNRAGKAFSPACPAAHTPLKRHIPLCGPVHKNVCLDAHSRRSVAATAAIFLCTKFASSRSVFVS